MIINVTKKQDNRFDVSWVSVVKCAVNFFVERNVTDIFDYTRDF